MLAVGDREDDDAVKGNLDGKQKNSKTIPCQGELNDRDCEKDGGSEMESNAVSWSPVKLCGIEEDSIEESGYIARNWLSVMGDEEDCVGLGDDTVGKQKQIRRQP